MIKSLLFLLLSTLACQSFAEDVASCAPDSRFENFACNGVVEVKNESELTQYLSNYGLKNNRVKNLNINFNIQNAPIYKIHSPCSISFKDNLNHNLVTNLCVHGKKGIRVKENNKFHSTSNVRFESNEEVIIDSSFKLSSLGDVEIISLGNLNGAKTRIGDKAEIDANNLLIKSNDRSVIGEYADLDIVNNFSLISNGDNVTDAAVIKENAKIKAGSIFIVANTKVRFGSGVELSANEVNLTGDNCSLSNNLTINSDNKLGNCFLNSSKSIFTVDKNSGEIPLVVNFSIKDEKVKLAKSFIWSLGNGDVITTTSPSLSYTYQNVGVYTASLKYADTQTKNGKFNYKSGGEVSITAKAITNLPPVASLACSTEYMLVNCNGLTSYDPELSPLTYTFKYSDGFSETNTTGLSTHAFIEPGLYNVELVVSDFAGLASNSSISVEALLPPNINPVAKLNCSSLKPLTLTCDAIGSSDSDGSIIQYKYTIDQNKVITNSTNIVFEEILSSGIHQVELQIIDNRGGISTASASVDVMVNLPPSFELAATPTSAVVPFDTVFEIKNAADSDGSIASVNWSFADNSTANISSVSKTISEIGNFTATATVTDELGASTTKTITVEGLEPLKTPPVAFFKYFHEGSTFVFLHANIRKTQFDIKRAYYIIDEGLATEKTVEMTEFYNNTINTINVETFGTHTIKLVVEDVRGQTAEFIHTAIVKANLNQINPYVNFGLTQSNIKEVFVNMNNSFTPDRFGKITNFQIDYGNGFVKNTGDETFDTYTYPTAGTYRIKITATTDRNLTTSLQKQIVITNQAVPVVSPVAGFGYKIYDFAQNVSFYNERSGSPNGGIISYEWNFGDGEISYGEHVAHFYEPGDYFVTLTVTDFMGLKVGQTQHVTILAPGDELATYSKCEIDNNMGAACRFFALDKFNEINYLNVSWGDGTEEFLTNPTIAEQGIYDQIHQYSQNGNFNLRLDVGTERGQFKSYTQELSVYSPNTITAEIQCSASYMYITCHALGSYDSSGSPLTYTFNYNGKNELSTTGILYFSAKEAGLITVSVTVKNAKNQIKSASTQVQALLPPNEPPFANVNCTSDTPHTITCSDSSTDLDGTIVVKEITFEEGKTFALTSEGTSYIYATSGEKSISVRLIDDMGGETIKTYNVVAKENRPPLAEFSCTTNRPQRISCVNNSSDPDFNDNITSLTWDIYKDSVLVESLNGILLNSFEKVFNHAGNIQIKLKVSDMFGGTNELTKDFVLTENQAPFARAACNSQQDQTYLCSASSYDNDGTIVLHQFYVDGVFAGTSPSFIYDFTNGGTYLIKYIATDDLGAKSTIEFSVTIDKPIASFSCVETSSYHVSCSYTKPENETKNIIMTRFFIDERDVFESASFEYDFLTPGEHTIRLDIYDNDGNMATTTNKMLIDQKYLAPIAEFTEFSEVGYRYKFDSSDSYKQGRNVVKFIWNFGDDSEVVQSNTSEVFHTFNREGYFNVNLTVLDDRGATSTITKNVYIYYADVPNPGPANDDTIEGIDSNNNGIRDDIERWIQYEAKDNVEVKTWLNKLAQKYQLQINNVSDQLKIREYETDKNNLKACVLGNINNDKEANHLLNVLNYLYISTELRSITNSKIEENLIGFSEGTIPTEQVERLKLCPSTP